MKRCIGPVGRFWFHIWGEKHWMGRQFCTLCINCRKPKFTRH